MTCVNLACRPVFIAQPDRINLDFNSHGSGVIEADLLSRLPGADESSDLVYCSHFLEHVPRAQVPAFLHYRAQGNTEKADFLVVEIIDQCVRREAGGELGEHYKLNAEDPERHQEMRSFLYERTGEDPAGYDTSPPSPAPQVRRRMSLRGFLRPFNTGRSRGSSSSLRASLRQAWFAWLLRRLPLAFMNQNVSMAATGERHHWFVNVNGETFQTSRHCDFPFVPLDVDNNGRSRKGRESMVVEASKAEVLH